MMNWLRGRFTGGAETVNKPNSLQEAIRAWENNETGINLEKRKAIYGDDGKLVEIVSVGKKKDPSFAILLNGEKYEVPGDNLTRGLPSLIGTLQRQSSTLAEWYITSVQLVNYKEGKTQKSCYFLTGHPLNEALPLLMNTGPVQ